MYKNNIKKYRKVLGKKLEDVAEQAGISTGYLCHLEKGTRVNPSRLTMENISKVLGKTIPEVFFEDRRGGRREVKLILKSKQKYDNIKKV